MRDWHEVFFDEEEMCLDGGELPPDGTWNWWKFKDGTVLQARFKYDIIDHFYPVISKNPKDIVAWAEL